MTETAVDLAAVKPRRRVNGEAGPVTPVSAASGRVNLVRDLARPERSVPVMWNGMTIRVRYRPDAVTIGEQERLMGQENLTIGLLTVQLLARKLAGWDLAADPETGAEQPTDEESLLELPPAFLEEVLKKINEADNPPTQAASLGSF